jgi:hypothetical protein
MRGEMFYDVNEVVIALVAIILLLLSIELGFRAAKRAPSDLTDSAKAPVLAIAGATLGLLALLLGFTFQMSLNRFNQRKDLVLKESNAITTAYLRARLLPEPDRTVVAGLLRAYVQNRLDFYNLREDPSQFQTVLTRSLQLQQELWSHAVSAVQKDDREVTTGLFIESLNEAIDLHANRISAMENHVPEPVLLLLISVAMMSALALGFACGLQNGRHFFVTTMMALLITMVIIVDLDLDRPRRGLIRVGQESMVRLHESIKNDGP